MTLFLSLWVTEFILIRPGSNKTARQPGSLDLKETFGNRVLSNRFPHVHDGGFEWRRTHLK
jgi:hypothetical protein